MDRIPGQIGYLLLNEDGAVISSSGDLENDEKSADIIMGLITLTSQIDPDALPNHDGFKKLSIKYEGHSYIVCLSNRKIHVVKKLNSVDGAAISV
ncbi:ragulator complex protein LAMTOR4 homolog [Photinus pyralis]|uniref:ragulator complex protein LAMTOR4 homolog n=1 Tax=Photinus pyralis TaxID=7054 RepID=UPI0012670FDF|nr:ragulator complex protein LAMTOR4 homolog [Photinus pyralis]